MLKAGEKAPEFQLAGLDGHTVSLETLRSRGPVLLAFYKSSCPTCQYTLPFLQRLHDANVVTISQDDVPATKGFRSRFGITLPVLIDPGKSRYPVSNAYLLTHVPSLYLIEPDGRIALAATGFSRSDLERIGERFGIPAFQPGEQTPAFKPG